jgi:hypothetical protein
MSATTPEPESSSVRDTRRVESRGRVWKRKKPMAAKMSRMTAGRAFRAKSVALAALSSPSPPSLWVPSGVNAESPK